MPNSNLTAIKNHLSLHDLIGRLSQNSVVVLFLVFCPACRIACLHWQTQTKAYLSFLLRSKKEKSRCQNHDCIFLTPISPILCPSSGQISLWRVSGRINFSLPSQVQYLGACKSNKRQLERKRTRLLLTLSCMGGPRKKAKLKT